MLATRPRSPSYILVVPLSGILLLELKIARVALEACCSMPLVLLCFRDEDPAEYNDKSQLNSSIHTVPRLRVAFFDFLQERQENHAPLPDSVCH